MSTHTTTRSVTLNKNDIKNLIEERLLFEGRLTVDECVTTIDILEDSIFVEIDLIDFPF